ncbi:hypothetical protein PHISCL_10374, partial [Aspergillus sclerotialis]
RIITTPKWQYQINGAASPHQVFGPGPEQKTSSSPPESPVPEEQKQPHISRLMKTIRKKKSMTTEGRSFSTGSTPPMPSATTPRTPYPHSSTTPVTDNAAQEPPRKKFRIPLFHRRQRPADVL